ncbi:MAG: recombinase family protein [Proteobacteria bacterium]|nr:recombinase family protein [Pseudomonadota bacterium]
MIRFAPIVRVSTEKQEQQGESLRTQKSQLVQYAKSLGGVIPEFCWQYSGQEHATPDFERRKLEKLLKDSSKGIFDAVIVTDASRWSRDNRKSKEGLQVFREQGIRFFVGTTEYYLFNPEHTFFLGMAAEIGEFHARQQSLKSITNRIERARRGIPSTGKLPYGRIFNPVTSQWDIDPEKQKNIIWAAERYLAGEPMGKISATLGMNHTNLWKVLTQRSGEEWTICFRVKKLNVDEEVTIQIPPLLPAETIAAIKERAAGNKTYSHGQIKNPYLLGRVVFCAECGYAMFGQTNHHNRRYYRHPRGRTKVCDPSLWVPAEDLEKAVMVQIVAMFGDPEILKEAVERATPNAGRTEELQTRRKDIEKGISSIQAKKDRLVEAVADGIMSSDEIRMKMDKLRSQEECLREEKVRIGCKLDNLPDYRRQVSKLAKLARTASAESMSRRPERLSQMTFQQKRQLVQTAFGGTDMDGKRLGVYIKKNEKGIWQYEIKGIVSAADWLNVNISQASEPTFAGKLPMKKKEAQDILGVDTDYSDFNPLEALEEGLTKFTKPCTAADPL